jgi:hypothetical protein
MQFTRPLGAAQHPKLADGDLLVRHSHWIATLPDRLAPLRIDVLPPLGDQSWKLVTVVGDASGTVGTV